LNYYLISIVNIIFVIFIIIILRVGNIYGKLFNFTSSPLLGIILFFSFYKVIVYLFMPILFDIINNYKYLIDYNIDPINSMYLYAIETVSWLFWIFGYLIIAFIFKNKNFNYRNKYIEISDSFSKSMLAVITLLFIFFRINSLVNLATLQNEAVPLYLEIFKSLASYSGAPSACVLFIFSFRWKSLTLGAIGAVGLFISIGTVSTRGSLIYTIIFLIIMLYYSYGKKYTIKAAFFLPMLLGLYIISGGLPETQIQFDDNGKVSIKTMINSSKKGTKTPFQEIDFRFGALSRLSTKFIEMYERGDGAGLNPIINSLRGFFPRSITPNKPHPSTMDGEDIYSQGMYKIYRETFGYDTFTMVEFGTGAHAYWELGWLGVIVLSTISGIYIASCSYYFQRYGILSFALIVTIIKPWGYMAPKIWVSDIVIQIYQVIFPLIILEVIVSVILKIKKIEIIQ
jgi:hypothetical protein